jgi:elongation factor Tu
MSITAFCKKYHLEPFDGTQKRRKTMTNNPINDRPVTCFDIIGNASKVRLSDAIRRFATASLPDITPTNTGHNIEYATGNAFFKCILIPDHTEYITWKLTTDIETDTAVCVLSAGRDDLRDGINELILAAACGRVIIFIDTDGADEKCTDMLESRIRDMLNAIWCRDDALMILRGSLMDAITSCNAGDGSSAPMARLVAALETPVDCTALLRSRPFLMRIKDCFAITGRGTAATGKVLRGELTVKNEVEVCGLTKESTSTVVTDIQIFHKRLDFVAAGDHISAILRGLKRDDIHPGQVLARPNTIRACQNFVCEIFMLPTEKGGRKKPFDSENMLMFYLHKADVAGTISFPEGSVAPGQTTFATVALRAPVALEPGTQFAVREGGRTVGHGYVTEVIADLDLKPKGS